MFYWIKYGDTRGSYTWNNVTVEDGCEIKMLLYVVGRDFVVLAYSKVLLLQQPTVDGRRQR